MLKLITIVLVITFFVIANLRILYQLESTFRDISQPTLHISDVKKSDVKKSQCETFPDIYFPSTLIPPSSPPVDILDQLIDLTGGGSVEKIKCPYPLIPFYNKVVRNKNVNVTDSSVLNPQQISRILHVSFKSRCLNKDLVAIMEQWKKTLPNYSIFFHDDDAVDRLIYGNDWSEFPHLHKLMQCVKAGAMTIDVWRVLLIYKYGGIYTDIDNWPHDGFTEHLINPNVSAFVFSDGSNRPSQWFFASTAHHPIMYFAMIHILREIQNIPRIDLPRVVKTTGPAIFKLGYSDFFCGQKVRWASGINVGLFDMKVQKMRRKIVKKYIQGGYKYADIVPLNAAFNVTRRQRIEIETGVMWWNNAKNTDYKNSDNNPKKGSCINLVGELTQE